MNLDITEDILEMIYFILDRELKPPFKVGSAEPTGDKKCTNVNDELIGWLGLRSTGEYYFTVKNFPQASNIGYKLSIVLGFKMRHHSDFLWWDNLEEYFRPWFEDKLGVPLVRIG